MTDGRAIVAVILASTVCLATVLVFGAASWAIVDKGLSVPTSIVSLLSTGFGALIGAVATYLGLRPYDTPPAPPPEPPPDESGS